MTAAITHLVDLWWSGIVRPQRAFDALRALPAPAWGFRVVVTFNVAISATSLLALRLLGREPFLPSWLTFLPTDQYFAAEILFLPFLRTGTWLLASAVSHLTVRLAGRHSDLDTILNIGGLVTFVVMPYTFVVDWTAILLGAYGLALIAVLHGAVDLAWSFALLSAGLHRLLGVPIRLALVSALLSEAATVPLLAVFAR